MKSLKSALLLSVLLLLPSLATAGHYGVSASFSSFYGPGLSFQAFAAPVATYSYSNAALAAQLQAQYLARQQALANAAYQANLQRQQAAVGYGYSQSAAALSFQPQRLLVPAQPYAAIGGAGCGVNNAAALRSLRYR